MDRDSLFRQLDQYCRERFIEIGQRRLERPILKSYVFETSRDPRNPLREFGSLGKLDQVDKGLFEISDEKGPIGYVEDMYRFGVFYTLLPTTDVEPALNRMVRDSQSLDNLWLSGEIFLVLFREITRSFSPWRFVRVSMGHRPMFEVSDEYRRPARVDGEGEVPFVADKDDRFEEELNESPASRMQISNRLKRLEYLVNLVRGAREFANISMLRIPALSAAGGHEFYHNGKVTNRSDDFLDHRHVLTSVVRMYERMTESLEDAAWLGLERGSSGSSGSKENLHRFKGSPVILKFSEPLTLGVFGRFLDLTFEKGKGPFRLWGNLLSRGRNCYHFYGLDLHLAQEIFLELTPSRFLALLPQGTCGNTIHRLVTNVQRYLSPEIEVLVGDKAYTDFAKEAFTGIGSEEPTCSG